MTAYSGANLDVKFIHPAGTVTISGDFTNFTYTPSVDFYEATAGADTNKTYISGQKDGRASLAAKFQDGANTGGTATFGTALAEGASGTLVWCPEGTATGKPKFTMPALSGGVAFTYPFAGVVEISIDFQQNGARVEAAN